MQLRKKRAAEINKRLSNRCLYRGTSYGGCLSVYRKYQAATGDTTKTARSTASPYKFPVVAVEAVIMKAGLSDFEALAQLHDIPGVAVHQRLMALKQLQFVIKTVAAADMQAAVDYLEL